jgi:uncharacterized membrane protein
VSASGAGVRRAAALGAVTGARTFLAPAALALRGRLGTAAKFAVPALAAGELVGDKLPVAPPRVQGPGLVGRVLSGALSGRVSGEASGESAAGARVGAAFALATTYPTQMLRSQIVERTGVPDVAYAVGEDLVAGTVAAVASDPARTPPAEAVRGETSSRGLAAAAGCGLAAAVVGTAAMTSAQQWAYGLTGGEGSEAPREVGEKILGAFGIRVKKKQRPALNSAMHAIYGTSWGLPFGLAAARGTRSPRPRDGLVLGLGVWAANLVELPALGVAPPPWKQSPASLAQDLGFHLVYGAATAAALEFFTA